MNIRINTSNCGVECHAKDQSNLDNEEKKYWKDHEFSHKWISFYSVDSIWNVIRIGNMRRIAYLPETTVV